jgi:hypothetical protein
MNKDWDYNKEMSNNSALLKKNIQIWEVCGKKICDYYTSNGNQMIHKDYYDQNPDNYVYTFKKTHLIFLLDSSGNLINFNI